MRLVRLLLGVVAIVLAAPVTCGGIVLWALGRHGSGGGWFYATMDQVGGGGYAVIVPDVDGLLRRDAPFARGTGTGLRLRARAGSGPVFVGLAPRAAVQRYLSGVGYTSITDVRLA